MKTMIWDYNGTILDDTQLCLSIENRMLKERGMKYGYTLEDYRNLFCFPVIDYYYKLGYTFENETYDDISVEFHRLYSEGFPDCKLTDGFIEKIEESIAKGYRNVIISAAEHQLLLKQCKELNIDSYFDAIHGIDNNLAGSKTEMAICWMKENRIEAKDCLYVGDTLHDLETANAMGIKHCVLIATGHQSYEKMKEKTENVVHSLEEVKI